MNCQITDQLFNVMKSMQEAQKPPRDYGTGQKLFHSELCFLDAVHKSPNTKAGDLSLKLGISKGAAAQMAAKLVDKGLIEVYMQDGNRKEKYYHLTPLGETARKGHENFHINENKRLCEYFCTLSDTEAQTILHFLQYLEECIPFCQMNCNDNLCNKEGT